MEKRLYSATEVSKDASVAFFLKLFDRDDLLERLAVVYAFNDADDSDDLPKQGLAERWLRMLSADRLRELADKVGDRLDIGLLSEEATDAVDDVLLDMLQENASDIEITRPGGMVSTDGEQR